MKERLIKAARVLDAAEEDIEFDGLTFKAKNNEITLPDLARQITYSKEMKQIAVTESYFGHVSPPPFMAGYAEIEIDTETL